VENINDSETLIDFISGKPVPNVGAEANRQAVERLLVEEKGFDKNDIEVDAPISVDIAGETYRSKVDLAVRVAGKIFMCIKCAPGSLGSREREIVAASRLVAPYQVPCSVVSDGKTAVVIETVSGRKIGEGLPAIPDMAEARKRMESTSLPPFPQERRHREGLIFRSYDSMNVNRA
jgi:hypothetical protein